MISSVTPADRKPGAIGVGEIMYVINGNESLISSRCALMIALFSLVGLPSQGFALVASIEVEQVPVDKLTSILTQEIESKPQNSQLYFSIARLHAMSYALKTETAFIEISTQSLKVYHRQFFDSNTPLVA